MSSIIDAAVLNPTDAARKAAFDNGARAGPAPYDPSEEYRRLLEIATDGGGRKKKHGRNDSPAAPDAYQHLMSRERRVLDTVDRVVNDAVKHKSADADRSLLDTPIHELAMRTVGAIRALFDDLVASRSIEDVLAALKDPTRTAYVGLALIALAAFLGALQVL